MEVVYLCGIRNLPNTSDEPTNTDDDDLTEKSMTNENLELIYAKLGATYLH